MLERITDRAITRDSKDSMGYEPTYSGVTSFLRRRYTKDLTGVDVAVSGVALDTATTNRPGARFGPRAIRATSTNMAWFGGPGHWHMDPFETLSVVDYGDCFFDPGKPQEIVGAIEAHATVILDAGATLLTLGGDHFIAYPLLRAYQKKYGPLSLVHFDAHSDTWREDSALITHHVPCPGSWSIPAFRADRPAHADETRFNILDAIGCRKRPAGGDRRGQKIVRNRRTCRSTSIASIPYAPECRHPVCGSSPPKSGALSAARGYRFTVAGWWRLHPHTTSARSARWPAQPVSHYLPARDAGKKK
jgi:hypothetical protein